MAFPLLDLNVVVLLPTSVHKRKGPMLFIAIVMAVCSNLFFVCLFVCSRSDPKGKVRHHRRSFSKICLFVVGAKDLLDCEGKYQGFLQGA